MIRLTNPLRASDHRVEPLGELTDAGVFWSASACAEKESKKFVDLSRDRREGSSHEAI